MPQSQRVTIESSTIQICGKCLCRSSACITIHQLFEHQLWAQTRIEWMLMRLRGFFGQGILGTGHRQSDRHPQRMNSTQHAETFNGAGQYTKRKGGTSQDASQKADQQWQGRPTGGSYIQSCQTFKCQIFKKSDKLSGLVIQAELNDSNSI